MSEPRYAKAARDLYRDLLPEIAALHPSAVCLEADHGGFTAFAERFPDRYFDVGIAEANMVSIAAGMAARGLIPFVNTMASFVTSRACEQLKLDVAYGRANVKIVASHAGLSGGHYGPTHHCLEDVAIVRALPHMTVLAPADSLETEKALWAIVEHPGPVYMRLGRKPTPAVHHRDYGFTIGRAVILGEGRDVAVIASGAPAVHVAQQAAAQLAAAGIDATVLNVHTIKPLDAEAVLQAAATCRRVVTVECHSIIGGLGSAVAEVLSERRPTPLRRVGVPDVFCDLVGTEDQLLTAYGVSADAVAAAARMLCDG